MEKKKFLTIRRIAVIIFLIVFSLIAYINFRGSYLEYKELGENFLQTFCTKEKYQLSVMLINFIFIFIIMYFAGREIKNGLKVFFDQEKKEIPKLPNKSIALVISAIESLFIGKMFTPSIIILISNTSFGQTDPVFNLDVSFYMFIEPLIKLMMVYLIFILVGIMAYSFGYYVIVFNKYFDGVDRETLKKSPIMKTVYRNIRLIAICLSIYMMVCSIDVVFDNFLTTDNNIKLAGSGIVDSTIKYWGYNILAIILLISIFRAVSSLKKGQQMKILKDLAVVPIYLVSLFIIMILFDFIYVRPNEFDKEKKYIENNISSTKRAYAIDCDIESFDYSGTITVDEVKENNAIIDNVILVDKQMVLDYLKETQSGTGYYTYKNAKLSNYEIDGIKKIMYVSPREIINNRRTYESKTYEYTHGYGLIFTDATDFTEDGKIKYIQNDITGKNEQISISTPQIYYGMETNSLVITNTKDKKEFDYADDNRSYESNYNGNAGLSLKFIDRLILALKQKNINLALSGSVTSNSKVLINRNIIKRAKMALPDIIYDDNPYTVVDKNGDIYWVIDGYTISSSYPYSTYTEIQYNGQKRDINYIRNSIKVTVNSYTGEMKFYITDKTDPIAMAYLKVYKSLFEEDNIPEDIQEQFIYPEFLYKVQATMLEEYHNTKADVLYRSDDTWERVSYKNTSKNSKTRSILNPYYTTVLEDGEETIGLIQMYSPKGKQSITSYLIGTVEKGKNKLALKSIHSDEAILGPNQLDIQISQDNTIQSEIDKLTVTGAKVTKNMIIVPIENTLLYIEPVYQTLVNESNLPVLKKVIVASGNKVAIGDNLKLAVENLISQYAVSIDTQNVEDKTGIIDALIKANKNLSESLNASNWQLIGNDIQKLQELINSLEKQVEGEKKTNTTNTTNNDITSDENVEEINTISE